MNNEYFEISFRLVAALAAGGIIGLERSFRGRAAGFRTHALVCIASSLLMLVTVYEHQWFSAQGGSRVVVDPTRMAQGIMTGIGFLGAGVIFKEGLTVRGLTTAASIWTTAAIGILFGVGFFLPAVLATLVTFGTLSVFRVIEDRIPTQFYAHNIIRFLTDKTMPENALRAFLKERGFAVTSMSYRLEEGGGVFEYRMMLRTLDKTGLRQLAIDLRDVDGVLEFRIAPGE